MKKILLGGIAMFAIIYATGYVLMQVMLFTAKLFE